MGTERFLRFDAPASLGGSALFYLALAAATARITFEERRVSEDQSVREWTAWVMTQPFGRFLIALIAFGFVAVSIGLAVKVFWAPYRDALDATEANGQWRSPSDRSES